MSELTINAFSMAKLVQAAIATVVFTLIYATFAAGSRYSKKIAILLIGLFSLVLIFAAGAYIGTYASGSMTIPGWAFGLGVNALGFVLGILVVWFWPAKSPTAPQLVAPMFLSLAGTIAVMLFALSLNYAAFQLVTQKATGMLFILFHIAANVSFIVSAFACRKVRVWSVYLMAGAFVVYIAGSVAYIYLARESINIWTVLKYIYLTMIPATVLAVVIIKWQILLRRYRQTAQPPGSQATA